MAITSCNNIWLIAWNCSITLDNINSSKFRLIPKTASPNDRDFIIRLLYKNCYKLYLTHEFLITYKLSCVWQLNFIKRLVVDDDDVKKTDCRPLNSNLILHWACIPLNFLLRLKCITRWSMQLLKPLRVIQRLVFVSCDTKFIWKKKYCHETWCHRADFCV